MNKSKKKKEEWRGRLPLSLARPIAWATRTAAFITARHQGGGRRSRDATHAVTPAAAASHQREEEKGGHHAGRSRTTPEPVPR